jgi:hypothetical protein
LALFLKKENNVVDRVIFLSLNLTSPTIQLKSAVASKLSKIFQAVFALPVSNGAAKLRTFILLAK